MRSSFAVLAFSALAAFPAPAALPTRDVSKTLPLAAGEGVRVDTYKGTVKVTTWEKAEVAVEARIEADPDCGSSSQQARWVEQTRVAIEKAARGVSIASDYDALEERWFSCTARPFVHYTIRMPKGAPLTIKDYKSDLEVKGLEADLGIETYKGRVDVGGLAGGFKVETYKGDVKAEIVRLAGDVHAETYKGSIILRLPAAAGFEYAADAGRRGEFESDFLPPAASRTSRRQSVIVHGAVNGGGPRVSLKTYKGTLALRKS